MEGIERISATKLHSRSEVYPGWSQLGVIPIAWSGAYFVVRLSFLFHLPQIGLSLILNGRFALNQELLR